MGVKCFAIFDNISTTNRQNIDRYYTCRTKLSGIGNFSAIVRTFSRIASFIVLSSLFCMADIMSSATSLHSDSWRPLVVIAGVPNRIPEGSIGFRVSSAIEFIFRVIPTSSRTFCASFPDTPSDDQTSARRR